MWAAPVYIFSANKDSAIKLDIDLKNRQGYNRDISQKPHEERWNRFMPRPKKCRRICAIPENRGFGPLDKDPDDTVEMTLDEYETIRLIDLLGHTQETCAQQMGVARTTVQASYNEARKKLAQGLIEGKFLVIKGGNYVVCPKAANCRNKRGCGKSGCCDK